MPKKSKRKKITRGAIDSLFKILDDVAVEFFTNAPSDVIDEYIKESGFKIDPNASKRAKEKIISRIEELKSNDNEK